MVGNGVNQDDEEGLIRFDVLWATLHRSRRWVVGVTVAVTLIVAVSGAAYLLWLQPIRTIATLEFSPTFKGAADEVPTYPNGVPFSAADIVGGLVLDRVHARSQLGAYCALDPFKSAFFVDRQSTEATFLASDYESRLANSQLSSVERSRLEQEYAAKKSALPVAFQLVFAEPTECSALPTALVRKVMSDTLTVWADDSQKTRGVLSLPISKFSDSVFDSGLAEGTSLIARGDFIRAQLIRISANADQVARTPGAATVRLNTGDSISQVQAALIDLIRTTEPLIAAAGQSSGREAIRWAQFQLTAAQAALKSAQGEEDVYRRALLDYSSQTSLIPPTRTAAAKSTPDSSEVAPRFDQAFLAGILSLEEGSVKYRQELTDKLIMAGIQADPSRSPVLFYENLLDAIAHGERSALTESQINERFKEVVTAGKALTARFNQLVDEISRVTLSVAAGLYRVDKPTSIRVERPFSPKLYLLIVAATFFATLILMIAGVLVRARLQEVART